MTISWCTQFTLDGQNLELASKARKEVPADALYSVCTRESKPSKYETTLELQAMETSGLLNKMVQETECT